MTSAKKSQRVRPHLRGTGDLAAIAPPLPLPGLHRMSYATTCSHIAAAPVAAATGAVT